MWCVVYVLSENQIWICEICKSLDSFLFTFHKKKPSLNATRAVTNPHFSIHLFLQCVCVYAFLSTLFCCNRLLGINVQYGSFVRRHYVLHWNCFWFFSYTLSNIFFHLYKAVKDYSEIKDCTNESLCHQLCGNLFLNSSDVSLHFSFCL